jgi:4-amino-4-deoxy-L-arabinose transferase-like glycosyltransferase
MSWPALLDRRWFAVVLVGLWALAYLPNLGTRYLRLEEGRRTTPAREMIASGDYVVPTLYGETYLNKPPLFYWLVAATGIATGEVGPLSSRLPSVLAAIGCALVALRFAPDVLDRRTRALAALFVLSSAALLDKGTLGEIDASLSLLVATALKVWWDGHRVDRQTPRSWVFVGLLLGASALLKGPAGPVLFYLTVGPFLVWQRRWPQLLTVGHLGCLAIAALPTAIWITFLLGREGISSAWLVKIWGHQLGSTGVADVVGDPASRRTELLSHYATFPLQTLGMLFPAVLWLPLAFRRLRSDARGVPEELRRLLVCGVLGPCVVFYIYPESRPRHLMPAFFPAAVLAAAVVSGYVGDPSRRARAWKRTGLVLSFLPAVAGVLSLALAVSAYPDGVPAAIAVLGVTTAWSLVATRVTRRTADRDHAWTLAATATAAALATWFAVNAIVVPWRAPNSPTRVALAAVEGKLPAEEVVYTTRSFPDTGERYYNLQFHLAPRMRAADVETLKLTAPCLAVVTPDERAELESEGWSVEEVARLAASGGPPEVHVIRIRIKGERGGVSGPMVSPSDR